MHYSPKEIDCIAISPNCTSLAFSTCLGITIFKARTGAPTAQIAPASKNENWETNQHIQHLHFSNDTTLFASSKPGYLLRWKLDTDGDIPVTFQPNSKFTDVIGNPSSIRSAEFVMSSDSQTTAWWNPATGKGLAVFSSPLNGALKLLWMNEDMRLNKAPVFSKNGQVVFVVNGKTLVAYNATSGNVVWEIDLSVAGLGGGVWVSANSHGGEVSNIGGSDSVSMENIVAATSDGWIVEIDGSSGKPKSRTKIPLSKSDEVKTGTLAAPNHSLKHHVILSTNSGSLIVVPTFITISASSSGAVDIPKSFNAPMPSSQFISCSPDGSMITYADTNNCILLQIPQDHKSGPVKQTKLPLPSNTVSSLIQSALVDNKIVLATQSGNISFVPVTYPIHTPTNLPPLEDIQGLQSCTVFQYTENSPRVTLLLSHTNNTKLEMWNPKEIPPVKIWNQTMESGSSPSSSSSKPGVAVQFKNAAAPTSFVYATAEGHLTQRNSNTGEIEKVVTSNLFTDSQVTHTNQNASKSTSNTNLAGTAIPTIVSIDISFSDVTAPPVIAVGDSSGNLYILPTDPGNPKMKNKAIRVLRAHSGSIKSVKWLQPPHPQADQQQPQSKAVNGSTKVCVTCDTNGVVKVWEVNMGAGAKGNGSVRVSGVLNLGCGLNCMDVVTVGGKYKVVFGGEDGRVHEFNLRLA
jgi:hypothetical protein